jgi:predicted ATPase
MDKMHPNKFLFFNHQGSIKKLSQFSDGTLLIIALVTKILSTKNNLFLIEEPENSTHPRALVDLIAFIKSFSENTQFIITSHSIAIVNKTSIEDIIVSSVNENGLCELYNVSNKKELKSRLRKSRINFSDELFFAIDDKNEFE